MSRQPAPRSSLLLWTAIVLAFAPSVRAQDPTTTTTPTPATTVASSADLVVLQALAANPVTAPYRIATSQRGGQVVLSGRVGTKQVHDLAVRTAIATGYAIRDDLTIDTAETYRVAAAATAGMGPAPFGASPSYVYPPPLFGRLDDPFFGFEPPLVSYPPWWRAVARREPIRLPGPGPNALGPATGVAPSALALPNAGVTTLQGGAVEMTLDPRGVAVLRGVVPSLADRVAIGQRVAQTPGVAQVVNLLAIGRPVSETPPPPPQPAFPRGAKPPEAPIAAPPANARAGPAVAVDRDALGDRIGQSFARRPALAGLPIRVSTRDGIASLSGNVPTVYEAMLAFRAVQQTPGVRDVEDHLQFVVPDDERKNPLQQKGRPEDVEPYLAAQVRRQVGDLAHVDRVQLRGDSLEIQGTLLREADRPRLIAILRSMPVLRGFRLEPNFVPEEAKPGA